VTLVLVRHGRTTANASGLLLGRADPPLDDTGRAQADALAVHLQAVDVQAVVSSPLRRAVATAEAIARRHGAEVRVDDRWIELDYGSLDGALPADVAADVWRTWRADPAFRPPGGESLTDLGTRVRTSCEELSRLATEGAVVVVSHVSPIKAAVAWALRVGDEIAWRMHLDVASITRIRAGPTGHGPVLLSFNENAHLGRRP
jgi:broad specificity phosphatase PhoE